MRAPELVFECSKVLDRAESDEDRHKAVRMLQDAYGRPETSPLSPAQVAVHEDCAENWQGVLVEMRNLTPKRVLDVHPSAAQVRPGRHPPKGLAELLAIQGASVAAVLETMQVYSEAIDEGGLDTKWWGVGMFAPKQWEAVVRNVREYTAARQAQRKKAALERAPADNLGAITDEQGAAAQAWLNRQGGG